MKKFVVGFLVGAGLTALIISLAWKVEVPREQVSHFPSVTAGAIVFDLKYRGLSGSEDELRYNSFWGFGSRGDDDVAFIQAVEEEVEEIETVYNPDLKGAEWAAVELQDNKAVAFYFDLNADSKLSGDEKILPTTESGWDGERIEVEFVTPDFIIKTDDGREVPFRVLLRAHSYEPEARPNCMWSPSCVLEGTSTFNGEPTKLVLYTNGFRGSFTEFGGDSYSLLTGEEEQKEYVGQETLSSIINYRGQFYRLKLNGSHEKGKTIRAVLEKDKTPTGEFAVRLAGDAKLKSELSNAGIIGSKDTTIRFNISGNQSRLPAKAYRIYRGRINYGSGSDRDWQLTFTEGPEFEIDPEKACTVELGRPKLSVSAIDEKKRYHYDVKEQSVYAQGTKIYLTRVIKGMGGELFGRYSHREQDSRTWEDKQPTIKIADSEGEEVLSAKMKYG
ncbi:MAG: hypothetical protein ACYS8Y_08965 [Planctomycetota bacterium]|jgi:hypothetical protein